MKAGGAAKAYPLSLIRERRRIEDRVGREQVLISYDDETDRVVVTAGEGREIQPIVVYWFVWKGIHPETLRYGKGAK